MVWQFWGRAARRPELRSSGRFLFEWSVASGQWSVLDHGHWPLITEHCPATFHTAEHPIKVLEFTGIHTVSRPGHAPRRAR